MIVIGGIDVSYRCWCRRRRCAFPSFFFFFRSNADDGTLALLSSLSLWIGAAVAVAAPVGVAAVAAVAPVVSACPGVQRT